MKTRILAVVMGTDRHSEEAFASLRAIAERHSVTLIMTQSASKSFGADRIRTATGVSDILVCDKTPSAVELTKGYDILVFATLSINGLSKMASFSADSLTSILAYYFLQTGKPIVVARDGIWCAHFAEPAPGTPAGRRVEEMLNQLRTLGMKITTARQLASEVLWACGDSRAGSVRSGLAVVDKHERVVETTVGTAGKVFQSDAFAARTADVSRGATPSGGACPSSLPSSSGPTLEHTGTADCPHCNPLGKMDGLSLQTMGAERIGVCHPMEKCHAVAHLIDHTLLKANATQEEVGKLCEEARRFCFASVCVNPAYVPLSAQLLRGSGVKVCTVVGFPLGSTTPTVKAIESRDAIANGADEIDMVINVGALKSGNLQLVLDDIKAVREATRGKVMKVILETTYLTRDEKIKACELSKQAGADFVKTSTGFGPSGATVEDIRLMREMVGPTMGVKASGGIRDQETALKMVEAGATRIGASASVAISTGQAEKSGGKY